MLPSSTVSAAAVTPTATQQLSSRADVASCFPRTQGAACPSWLSAFHGTVVCLPRSAAVRQVAPVKTRELGRRSNVSVSASAAASGATAPPAPTVQKKTDVQVVQLTQDTLLIRGLCAERLKFEVEYGLQVGTTENTYAVTGPNGTALIDVPDESFAGAFAAAVMKNVPDAATNRLSLVIGHLSPKRVASVVALLEARGKDAPRITAYCTNPAAQTLQSSIPVELIGSAIDAVVVRPGLTLDLGGGHELRFIKTPTPRWPDAMVTYDPATRLAYTNKFFSAHIRAENAFDVGGWDVFGPHWQFFYDCMLAPVARQVDAALDKLPFSAQFAPPSYVGKTGIDIVKADLGYIWSSVASLLNLGLEQAAALPASAPTDRLPVSALCPLHGPVVRSSLTELVREYQVWTTERVRAANETTVAVIYASAYGNTSALAQAISRGLLRAGVGVESVNAEQSSLDEIAGAVERCCAFVVGSPTLGGHMPTPVQEALGVILRDSTARSKPAGVFGSFGWSGEAVDEIEQRLKDGGFSLVFPSIRCKFKPTDAMLQVCEESGRDLAREVRKLKLKTEKAKSSIAAPATASGPELAVGRVVGSLCVVSAVKGDAQSAMLASWVSQASFTPPGITLAVAKERAVESLLLIGDTFAISVLGDGANVGAISKQLLKPFSPGEPRFGSLPVKTAKNGSNVLQDAIAYLECTIKSRMEAGDHWILYATVDEGDLQNDKALTAVHHRKTGSRY